MKLDNDNGRLFPPPSIAHYCPGPVHDAQKDQLTLFCEAEVDSLDGTHHERGATAARRLLCSVHGEPRDDEDVHHHDHPPAAGYSSS